VSEKLGEVELDIFVDISAFERQMKRALDAASRGASRMAKALDKVGKKMKQVGKDLSVGLSLPILGAGIAAGKLASDFDMSLSQIVGLVGKSREQVGAWREDILALGPAVGKGPDELAKGMFFVTSAGQDGAQALDTLTQSARGSAAGLGETAVVADAATTIMNAYASSNISAGDSVGLLAATVKLGKAEADSIASSIGNVISVAAEMGVQFHEVGAAIAATTRLGVKAPTAINSIRATLSALQKTTPQADKALKEFGLSAAELRETMAGPRGLLGALQDVEKAVDGDATKLSEVFPSVEALGTVFTIVGKNAKASNEIFKEMANSGVKDLDLAFNAFAEQSGFKFAQAMVRINTLMVRIGDTILPVVVPLIEKMGRVVEQAANKFKALDSTTKAWIVAITGTLLVLGPLLSTIGFMTIGLGGLTTAIQFMGTVAVAAAKLVKSAFVVMASGPALLIGSIAAIVAGFVVFKTTITGLAVGIVEALKIKLVNGFNDMVVVPFKTMLRDMMGSIPYSLKKGIKLTTGIDLFGEILIPKTKGSGGHVDLMKSVLEQAGIDAKQDMANFSLEMKQMWEDAKSMIGFGPDGSGTAALDEAEAAFNKLKALVSGASGEGGKSIPAQISEDWKAAGAAIKDNLGAGLEDAVLQMRSFGDVGREVLQDILRHMLRLLVIKPLLDGLTGGTAGFFSSFLGGGTAGFFSSFLGGGKAGGGRINGPTLVGERGPEIVNPGGPATVMNAMNSKRAMGGSSVNLVQNINFTADVKNTVRAEIVNAAPIIADMASGQVFDQMKRQGNR